MSKSISERTDNVISSSDALVFLPGGIGTIYELFTAIESKRCHEFNQPIIIYNSNGYFDKLLAFMEKMYHEHFSESKDKENYFVTTSISAILYYINNYEKRKEDENCNSMRKINALKKEKSRCLSVLSLSLVVI